ncbi:MAG TPA: helix-turn-helix transcriptional regulator, partial [Cyclobacteriaceae bacterium]|nr:helix-turn-helix transcriptional regulator [Cyclobacteriaceae bacterium]
QLIRTHRKRKILTQSELGDKASISYVQISNYEKDKVRPTLDTMKKISKFLEIDEDQYLGFYTNRESDTVDYSELRSTLLRIGQAKLKRSDAKLINLMCLSILEKPEYSTPQVTVESGQ